MENVPGYIYWVFAATVLTTVLLFYKAARNSNPTLVILLTWLAVQAAAGLWGFYTITNANPPRFVLLAVPPLLLIVTLFATKKGRRYIDGLNIKTITLLHTVRIPVELVLFWLYLHKAVPKLMTFEGGNFDIFSGLTAPFIYYFGLVKQKISKGIIIGWNIVCLLLLANIVVRAVLSAPFPFQRFAFDQPNIAILHFPFVWLPCCIVPLVLFSHLAGLRQLVNEKKNPNATMPQ